MFCQALDKPMDRTIPVHQDAYTRPENTNQSSLLIVYHTRRYLLLPPTNYRPIRTSYGSLLRPICRTPPVESNTEIGILLSPSTGWFKNILWHGRVHNCFFWGSFFSWFIRCFWTLWSITLPWQWFLCWRGFFRHSCSDGPQMNSRKARSFF